MNSAFIVKEFECVPFLGGCGLAVGDDAACGLSNFTAIRRWQLEAEVDDKQIPQSDERN